MAESAPMHIAKWDTDSARGWTTVGATVLSTGFGPSAILILSFGIFMQQWSKSFGWPIGQIALGSSVISVMIMIVSPLQGWLADRIGARRLLLWTIPFWTAGLALMAALPASLPVFYLACVLLPICAIGLWPPVPLKIVTTWFDRRLGLALGVTNTGLGIGAVILPIALQAVFESHGWRIAYLLLAGQVVLITLPIALWKLREHPAVESQRQASRTGAQHVHGARSKDWKSSTFLGVAAAFLVQGAISSALIINFVPILVAASYSPAQAVATQAFFGVGSVIGRIGAGWLLDYVHARWIGAGLAVAGTLSCLLLTDDALAATPLAAPTAALCLGLMVGSEFDLLAVVIRRNHGIASFGRLFGIVFAVFQFGAALGIALIAQSHDRLGSYTYGLSGLAVLALVAGFLLLRLPPYPNREPKSGLQENHV